MKRKKKRAKKKAKRDAQYAEQNKEDPEQQYLDQEANQPTTVNAKIKLNNSNRSEKVEPDAAAQVPRSSRRRSKNAKKETL